MENGSAHLFMFLNLKVSLLKCHQGLWVALQLISEMNTALELKEDLNGINTPLKEKTI